MTAGQLRGRLAAWLAARPTNGDPSALAVPSVLQGAPCGLDGESVAAAASWSESAKRPHPVEVSSSRSLVATPRCTTPFTAG
jgi:hypothetical protein